MPSMPPKQSELRSYKSSKSFKACSSCPSPAACKRAGRCLGGRRTPKSPK